MREPSMFDRPRVRKLTRVKVKSTAFRDKVLTLSHSTYAPEGMSVAKSRYSDKDLRDLFNCMRYKAQGNDIFSWAKLMEEGANAIQILLSERNK